MGWWRRVLIEGNDPAEEIGQEAGEFLKTGKVPERKQPSKKQKKRKEKR